jgi:hypothetical protein
MFRVCSQFRETTLTIQYTPEIATSIAALVR